MKLIAMLLLANFSPAKPSVPQLPAPPKPCVEECTHSRFFKICGADLYPANNYPASCSANAPIQLRCDQTQIVCQ